jgi:hypothetical protein
MSLPSKSKALSSNPNTGGKKAVEWWAWDENHKKLNMTLYMSALKISFSVFILNKHILGILDDGLSLQMKFKA